MNELTKSEPMPVARPEPTVADMLQTVISGGISAESVGVMEKLVGLYERMEDKKAEKAFAAAFVSLQADIPKVQACQAVPNNDGTVRYKFAPFEKLMDQIGPLLQRHGFTVSFSNRYDGARLVQTCTLQHVGGHKRSNDFAVRIGSGPPKATECQADGAAATYAKRFALCDCLNIVVAHMDNDARAEGGPITAEQAASLRERVKATGTDEARFLKFAGNVYNYEEIPAGKYGILDENLRKKETKP